jgi:hypothetical protein
MTNADQEQNKALVLAEWHFENRPVDLVAERYDAAIGGGFDLSSGIVARALRPRTSFRWHRRPI